MIGESGLAGVNRRLEVQKAAWQLGAYAAMALVAVLGLIALVGQLRAQPRLPRAGGDRRRRRCAGRRRRPRRRRSRRSCRASTPCAPSSDSANRYRDDTPWAMRWGLYQGGSVGNAARDAYLRELDSIVLPRFAARIKQRLIEYASEPEKLYVYLKAYLMLGEPQHLDKKHLQLRRRSGVEAAAATAAARHVAVDALPEPARIRRHAAPDRPGSGARRAGAQHHPAGVDPADHVRPAAAQLQRAIPRARCGSTSSPASASRRCSGARAGAGCRSRCRASTRKRSSRRSPDAGMLPLVKQFADDEWVWGDRRCLRRELAEAHGAGHRSVRTRLHQRLGRAPERPRARAVLDRAAIRRRAWDPRRTDLAAARHSEDRRRQHVSGRARRRSAAPGASPSIGDQDHARREGHLQARRQRRSRATDECRAGHARHAALPADPPAHGRGAGADRRHPRADSQDSGPAAQARSAGGWRTIRCRR